MADSLSLRMDWAHKWTCDEYLDQLRDVYQTITSKELRRSSISQELSSTRKVMDDIQLTATLSIEGRNTEERKARTVEYLQKDADYQAVSKRYDDLEGQRDTLTVEIGSLGRQVRYLEFRIDYNMSMLKVIGG